MLWDISFKEKTCAHFFYFFLSNVSVFVV